MDEPITLLPLTSSRPEQIFPTLTPAQVRRIAAHGQRRKVQKGEILVAQGDKAIPFFVVLAGELEAVRPGSGSETLITIFRAEQFTGGAIKCASHFIGRERRVWGNSGVGTRRCCWTNG